MQVIDAVEVHVLSVPRESGLPHAKIQIGGVDALDSDAAVMFHRIQNGTQMANIPFFDIL